MLILKNVAYKYIKGVKHNQNENFLLTTKSFINFVNRHDSLNQKGKLIIFQYYFFFWSCFYGHGHFPLTLQQKEQENLQEN